MKRTDAIEELKNNGWEIKDRYGGIIYASKILDGIIVYCGITQAKTKDDSQYYIHECSFNNRLFYCSNNRNYDNFYIKDYSELLYRTKLMIDYIKTIRSPITIDEIPNNSILIDPVIGFVVISTQDEITKEYGVLGLEPIYPINNDLPETDQNFSLYEFENDTDKITGYLPANNNIEMVSGIIPNNLNTFSIDFCGNMMYEVKKLGLNYKNTRHDQPLIYWKNRLLNVINEKLVTININSLLPKIEIIKNE